MARPGETYKKPQFYALASVAIILALLYFGQEVLIPLALGVLFTFVLAPAVKHLERLRLGRVASTLLVVVLALSLVGAFGWVVEKRFVQIAEDLPRYREGIRAKFRRLTRSGGVVEKVREEIKQTIGDDPAAPRHPVTQPSTQPGTAGRTGGAGEKIRTLLAPAAPVNTPPAIPRPTPDEPWPVRIYPQATPPLEVAGAYFGRFLSPLATAGLVIVFVVFMLLGREELRDRLIRLVGEGRLHVTTEALDDAASRVSRFLVAQSLINASYGVLVAAGLWAIDLTLGGGRGGILTALLAGLLCGVLRFVPYIGPWLGAALPLGLAFAAFPGNGVFFATLGMFVVIELAVSQGVEPRLLGASTGISPIAVLVAAVFWTWLWGPIGLLLSTPLTVLLVVMGKYVPQLEFLDVLLGDKPVLDPPTRVYQRLIAGDDEEALGLAQDCLKEMSLEAVYDAVLIPALAKAEVDRHRGMLDEARHAAVRQGLREIAEALGDQQRAEDSAAATAMTVREAKGTNGDAAAAEARSSDLLRPSLPKGATVHVLCLPAHDAGDEVVGLMLAQLLERRGYRVTAPSAASLASERVELAEDRETDAVVVSATPPKAALHARYLLKRLSVRNPGIEVFLGLWGNARASNDPRSHDFGAARVVTSLAEAQEQLDQLAHRRTVVGVPQPAL